jgi:hypothetical protein
VVCNIPLESSWQGLQRFFRLHLNRRSAHKIMGPPKLGESQLWKFWDSYLGVPRPNDIWVLVPWSSTKYTIRGKVLASPKFTLWWVLWVRVARGLFVHQKCSNYALTNLFFGLDESMWVIDLLVILLSSHLGVPTHPSIVKVLQARECAPTHSPFVVFTCSFIVEAIKEFGGASGTLWVFLLRLSNLKMTLVTLNTKFHNNWEGLYMIEHVLFKD